MIFLIRHGQTEFNRDGRLQGRLDSPLTELGVEQARRMGRVLKDVVDDAMAWQVISSPLGRARRTAEIVRDELGLDGAIEVDERLVEVGVGVWEGLMREEIERLAPGRVGVPGWLFTASPGGETYEDVATRLGSWLAGLDEHDGRRRLVVCHGVAGRVLRGLYLGLAQDEVLALPAPPQDAVFRLFKGTVGRIDEGSDL